MVSVKQTRGFLGFFSVFMKADVIIFAMFALLCIAPAQETLTLLHSSCQHQSLLKMSTLYYYGKETTYSVS